MEGTVHLNKDSIWVVRWINGKNLITGKDYEWECTIKNPQNLFEGQNVVFKMIDTFEVEIELTTS